MNKLFIILIDGPMGSGKTTTSKLLNEKLPDTARIALPDIKRLVPSFRENPETLRIIREVMLAMIDKYLVNGVNVIVDQITKSEGANLLKETAEKYGGSFYGYRLTANKELRWNRVKERTRQMMEAELLPQNKIDELLGYFEPNDLFYAHNPIEISETIATDQLAPEQVADLIISKLSV